MNEKKARNVLNIDRIGNLDSNYINGQFRKAVRKYHPDSPYCKVSQDSAGRMMDNVKEARQFLLDIYGEEDNYGITMDEIIKEEMNEWKVFMMDVLDSGCLFDGQKEFPMDRFVTMLASSKMIDKGLTQLKTYFDTCNKSGV